MKKLRSKLPEIPESIFTTMSLMAREEGAINLSQGFPDFDPDAVLLDLVSQALEEGHNQYAPLGGIYSLRETISAKILSLYGREYHPQSEITVTVGATQAIFTAIAAFVWPGDEVIVLKPAYDCYEPAVIAQGGIPITVQMSPVDYSVDWDLVWNAINPNTRMIIINTPHNPSGHIFSEQDMLKLQELLAGTDVLLLSDEVYEHIVFDDLTHESASKYEDLASRSLICASFGKTFHVTGWKMGYCVAPAELMKEFQKIHEFNVFCANHPMQRALANYLQNPEHYLNLGAYFQAKRDLFLTGIADSRFKYTPSQGTYFQVLNFSEITDENDVSFARRLTREKGVASIPISVFNQDYADYKQLRFCFAKKDDTLMRAIEILRTI